MADKVLTHPRFQQAQPTPVGGENEYTRPLREMLVKAAKGEVVTYAIVGVGEDSRSYGFFYDKNCMVTDAIELLAFLNMLRDEVSESLRDYYSDSGEDTKA